jgi:hypothetical protein
MEELIMNFLAKKSTLIISMIFVVVTFVLVMLVINPIIDGADGLGLITLQLSFDKSAGIAIVNSWGESGVTYFNQWIFSDFIYAFSYALFFASLLSFVMSKKGKIVTKTYKKTLYLPLLAGLLDWLEDSMELVFINNQISYSDQLFFVHSLVASTKFALIIITLILLVKIWKKASP